MTRLRDAIDADLACRVRDVATGWQVTVVEAALASIRGMGT